MQIGPENDCFQFMSNSVYGPFSISGVLLSNSVVFYYNPMVLYLSPENFSIIYNYPFHFYISIPYPPPPPQRKQLFELRVNTLQLEQ